MAGTGMARLVVGAIALALIVVMAARLLPGPQGAGPASATAAAQRVYSVAQFVQPVTGPLWTTRRKALFLIRGVLRRVPMQPVADFLLSDRGSQRSGSGGLALASGQPDALVSTLLGLPLLRPLLPPTPDNPVLGRPATYRIAWTGCPSSGCARSPWQLVSGGQ